MKPKWSAISVSILCIVSAVVGITWSEPQPLGDSGKPLLFLDNQANCWCDASDSIRRYDSGTSAWIAVTESRLPSRDWGAMCFDKGDTLWAIKNWRDVYFHRYYDGSWFDGEQIYDGALPPCLALTADSTGGVWVFFDFDERCHVVCMRYKDGVWDTLSEHVCNPGGQLTLAATTDAVGKVWFGWWYKWYSDSTSYLKTAHYDGGSWSDTMAIDSSISTGFDISGEDIMAMDFAPDGDGGLWAVWEYAQEWEDPNDLHARYWNGEEWSELDTIAKEIKDPRVAMDEYGNAWVVWEKTGDIYYSVNSGSGWSQTAPVYEASGFDGYPDVEVDGAGRVWCAWRTGHDDSNAVYVSFAEGLGIGENTEVQPEIIRVESTIGRHFTFHISPGVISESLDIYDAGGRMVRSLAVEGQTVAWDGKDQHEKSLPSGVYFIKPDSNPLEVRKIVLIR